jgi:hypothetical protein
MPLNGSEGGGNAFGVYVTAMVQVNSRPQAAATRPAFLQLVWERAQLPERINIAPRSQSVFGLDLKAPFVDVRYDYGYRTGQ